MHQINPIAGRRSVLAGLAIFAASAAVARAQPALDASAFGLLADTGADQSALLQQAMDSAAAAGQVLRLPAGAIEVADLVFPARLLIEGVPGRTELRANGAVVGRAVGADSLLLRDLVFSGSAVGGNVPALLAIEASEAVTLERCLFSAAPAIGLAIADAAVTIRDCAFTAMGDAAIHALDSRGLLIEGNRIDGCGNAGIRIWRSDNGPDGSILTANRIANIDWLGGGNGQNGNGINVFKADGVIVTANHITGCAFSAVRLNSTRNTQIAGNVCLQSGEIAIFSEFAFSGSVIANNIIDGAASGISMTNMDSGGHLAVCSGNIVRNIAPSSAVNPDTVPIGIAAEADAAITGNTIQSVPGIAVLAGYGPFLRNVGINGNVVSECDIGIAVSVVDGAGRVTIAANLIDARKHAVVGMAWGDIVEPDLLANLARYQNVSAS